MQGHSEQNKDLAQNAEKMGLKRIHQDQTPRSQAASAVTLTAGAWRRLKSLLILALKWQQVETLKQRTMPEQARQEAPLQH